jgi:hypothetical protein
MSSQESDDVERPYPIWIQLSVGVPRLVIAAIFAIAATRALRFGISCHWSWSALGAATLMYAWAIRWAMSAAALPLRPVTPTLRTMWQRVQGAGFAVASLMFAAEAYADGSLWPYGLWPLVVSILFLAAAVVYLVYPRRG